MGNTLDPHLCTFLHNLWSIVTANHLEESRVRPSLVLLLAHFMVFHVTLRFFKESSFQHLVTIFNSKFHTGFQRYHVRSSLVLLVAYLMISRDNLAALQVRSSPVLLLAHFMVSPAALPIPYCVSLGGPQMAIQCCEASRNVFPFDVCWLALNKGFVALLLILSHAVNLVECWKYSRGPLVSSFLSQGQRSEISQSVNRSFFKSILVIQILGR